MDAWESLKLVLQLFILLFIRIPYSVPAGIAHELLLEEGLADVLAQCEISPTRE